MSFVHPSIEGSPVSTHDPWDWTVDEVVFALTGHGSPLLQANAQLYLPDADILAKVFRENDVTGLALLTEVTSHCLRDELGIKSLGHRAAISHLIRQLQDVSLRFQEQSHRSARLSSMSFSSRVGTPHVATPLPPELRGSPRALGLMLSPAHSSAQPQEHSGSAQTSAKPRNALEVGPEIPGLGKLDEVLPDKVLSSSDTIISSHEERAARSTKNLLSAERAEPEAHQGETIIVDDNGRKRRRLVIAQPSISELTQTNQADSLVREEPPPSSPETLQKDTNADTSLGSDCVSTSGRPVFDEEKILDTQEPPTFSHAFATILEDAMGLEEAVAEPGTVSIDENGRKRIKPTLVHRGDVDTEDQQPLAPIARMTTHKSGLPSPLPQDMKYENHLWKRSYRPKIPRNADQTYLGFESMPVDNLIYGDTALGKELDAGHSTKQTLHPDESDDFTIISNSKLGEGQRLYVNARMKYLLRQQRVSLERDDRLHTGVIPYPENIGKKNYPSSITIFSPSSHGIMAIRANRSEWVKEKTMPTATEAGERTGNTFNVADPALARDESNDPEWKALEKWNFVDGEDEILPLYGESGSEGEYDSQTRHDMEKEQEKITRPLGRPQNFVLPEVAVKDAIDVAIEKFTSDWSLKRLPKLAVKGWQLWTESRRNRDSKSQIELSKHNLKKLESRIASLRNEIAKEAWSKASQIITQCQSLQPSIYEREDCRWKIATLELPKAPKEPSPALTQPRPSWGVKPGMALKKGEKGITTRTENSDSSGSDLDDFIVADDAEEDTYEPVVVDDDDDPMMAEVKDSVEWNTFVVNAPQPKTPPRPINEGQSGPSPSDVIDLTQLSDPVEPEAFLPKSERSYTIKTPPLYGSEDDGEIFQRSRRRKPVFKVPPTAPKSPTKVTQIISLESDTDESVSVGCITPALSDVEGIRAMDPAGLVEKEDRKRLLIWLVAHTPPIERRAAFRFMNETSMEDSRAKVKSCLTELLRGIRDPKPKSKTDSDIVMRIASWLVGWTIPVKVTTKGLQTSHITNTLDTLEDIDFYEPFYDVLLQCSKYYRKISSHPNESKPKKRRQIIRREDSDDQGLLDSQNRLRKYAVPESQEALSKRHAAQDRLRGDEERRRREELKSRYTGMGISRADTSRVVVNPGKLADQDFIYLNPRFGNGAHIKPHQEEGLQFLWREITSEHKDLQGCLLAQTMGLGKTMQVIALLVTLSEASRSSNQNLFNQVPPSLRKNRTLILCPPALIENWWDECLLWLPLPLSDNIGELRKVNKTMKQTDRLLEIQAWSKTGGILLLGFDAFKGLINNKPRKGKIKDKAAPLDDRQHEMVKRALLQRPTLVVADEAHYFKRKSSVLSIAMNQIQTKSRIALTGSPLSNNLGEYHSLIDWIAPGYLGNDTEFKATYEEPIREGLYQDSTESQYRESRKRLKALELELEPKVHRANESCLHAELEGKSEFVITVPLTELQKELYQIYAGNMLTATRGKEPGKATLWSWLSILKLLCNHPKCYQEKLFEVGHEPVSPKRAPQKKKAFASVADEAMAASEDDIAILDEPVSQSAFSQIKVDSRRVFQSSDGPIVALSLSNKVQVLMKILAFSQDAHDKVLVFSHSIPTLDYVGAQLLDTHQDFIRIDGKVDPQKRQSMTKLFNEGDTNICLISTKAGGQGLNFFGANRVVILDEHFNPTWELQAIGRAYRIGQQKHVYVYRLTVAGTFEQAIQNQALFKEHLATRVVDKKNPNRSALKSAGHYLFPPKTVDQEDLSPFVGKDALVLDRLLASQTE